MFRSEKRSGWLEILGAGMVDPAVLEAVGYDPDSKGSLLAWVWSVLRCCAGGSTTSAFSMKTTSGFWTSSTGAESFL